MHNKQNLNFEVPLSDMNLDTKKIIEFLTEQRKLKNLKQGDVAKIIGTTQQMLSHYENLKTEIPIGHINKWCEALGMSAVQVIMYLHPLVPIAEDLAVSEEKKQKEIVKTKALEKLQFVLDEVKNIKDEIKKI